MAIFSAGFTPCSICGVVLTEQDERQCFTHFVPAGDPLERWSDSCMHLRCLDEWQFRDLFIDWASEGGSYARLLTLKLDIRKFDLHLFLLPRFRAIRRRLLLAVEHGGQSTEWVQREVLARIVVAGVELITNRVQKNERGIALHPVKSSATPTASWFQLDHADITKDDVFSTGGVVVHLPERPPNVSLAMHAILARLIDPSLPRAALPQR